VVDLGCWPGGWLQVASRVVGPKGRVVGVDVAELDPAIKNENVIAMVGDLSSPELCEQVRTALGSRAHVILSDAAPKITGVREADRAREEALLEAIEALIPELLQPHGDLLMKILEAPEVQAVERRIRTLFARAKSLRPAASRKGSSERYLIARDFRG
jgi:23S rRNA (uridine2552-2'-O)-methyltransferase